MIQIEEIRPEELGTFWDCHIRYLTEDGIISDEEDIAYFTGSEYRGILEAHRQRETDRQHMAWFVREGKQIGAVSYCTYQSEDGKCFILDFWVFPPFRGGGTGHRCFEALARYTKADGAKYYELNSEKEASVRFWKSLGFTENGQDEYGMPLYIKREGEVTGMLNKKWVSKTEAFLKQKMDGGDYMSSHPDEKAYRIEHTYRVANIGREIARKEGFDETEMVIACLLHDISYCEDFDENGWKEHGRRAAQIARPFLRELGMAEERVQDICYGIAIHVDDEADFEGERTPFALSVGDADNIDRFDAYRIHEILKGDDFLGMCFEEKQEYVEKRLARLRRLMEVPQGTKTAEALWKERLSFYISFFEKLEAQLKNSCRITDPIEENGGQP